MNKVFLYVSAFCTFNQSIIDSVPEYLVMSGVPLERAIIDIGGYRWFVHSVTWGEVEKDGYYYPKVIIK